MHLRHRQRELHVLLFLKQSQYCLLHFECVQLQKFLERIFFLFKKLSEKSLKLIFGIEGYVFSLFDWSGISSTCSTLEICIKLFLPFSKFFGFSQFTHLQISLLHFFPFAKHSQYFFRHFDFSHVHLKVFISLSELIRLSDILD
jgi:hypothetical protein